MRTRIAGAATLALVALCLGGTSVRAQPTAIVDVTFDTGPVGFTYRDDVFRGTRAPEYARGYHQTGGEDDGALVVELGGMDYADVLGMSGGWRRELSLEADADVIVELEYNLVQTGAYEWDEVSEVLVSVDSTLVGMEGTDVIDSVQGDGNWGAAIETGWQRVTLDLGTLGSGTHELVLGAYNNKKTYPNESTRLLIGRVIVSVADSPSSPPPPSTGGGFTIELLDRPVGFQTVPFDMNDRGEAVGYYLDNQLNYRAIRWDANGTPSDLAAAGTWSQAHGIAEDGRICGYYGPTLQSVEPTVWTGAEMQTLELAGAVPSAITSTGRAVGSVTNEAGDREIAFWEGTRSVPPTGERTGAVPSVNESGEAVGNVLVDGFPRAAFWDAQGNLTLLPGVGGETQVSGAHAISDSGRILGSAQIDGVTRPVVWESPDAAPRTLARFEDIAGVARDINDDGWAVGVDRPDEYNGTGRALLWRADETPVDLNTLIEPSSEWTLIDAVSVNDADQTLGRGFYSGAAGQVVFRLTPADGI